MQKGFLKLTAESDYSGRSQKYILISLRNRFRFTSLVVVVVIAFLHRINQQNHVATSAIVNTQLILRTFQRFLSCLFRVNRDCNTNAERDNALPHDKQRNEFDRFLRLSCQISKSKLCSQKAVSK